MHYNYQRQARKKTGREDPGRAVSLESGCTNVWGFSLPVAPIVATVAASSFGVPQRSVIVSKVAGVQNLRARIVLAVERRNRGRATRGHRGLRRVKPETEVVHLDGIEGRI